MTNPFSLRGHCYFFFSSHCNHLCTGGGEGEVETATICQRNVSVPKTFRNLYVIGKID